MPDVSFAELTGQRAVVRRFGPADVAEFVAYRSDPEVARYQSWDAPYPRAEGERLLAQLRTAHQHRITASCDARNTASAAVLERLGMRREGYLRQSTWAKGEWTDDLLYALLEQEWQISC